ncbi:MAG: glycosyltransferase [Actinomycetia bacterium]|nr:glycosyltransferase [Actinomycetes bacterium]
MVREAIESVRAQTYDGIVETVVVYDQSEADPTLQVPDARRPVRVVTNRRSPGLAGARNSGIESASGELIAFCDDDDLWLPEKLRHQVSRLADPSVDFVSCGIRVSYDGADHERLLDVDEVTFRDLLRDRHTELHPSTFLIRRTALDERIGPVDETVPGGFGEDYEFLLRAARNRPIANVRNPYVVVRWGTQSYFFQRWETMRDGLTWLLERYPEFDTEPAGSARVRAQIAFARAALGDRTGALHWARGAFRRNPLEPRTVLAAAVSTGLVTPDTVMTRLHRIGRGI